MILEKINSPKDIRPLSISELEVLAKELREKMIEVVSKNGGHLAPSLGVVELTLALHYVFDTPRDKLIWDVGHQTYAHKLITGRRESFDTLRQYGGISGFPRRDESEYDTFGTGHSSTSISAALGMACARDLKGEKYKIIAVIGDGALTAGMAYEGMNQAGFLHKNMVIVLNDNKMSISENVGGMSKYLNKIVTAPMYNELKNDVWEVLGKLPSGLGDRARLAVRKLKEGMKNLVIPTILFEELGLQYIGPIDGHNLSSLIQTFESVKNLKHTILVHVLTEKGRGYEPARNNLPRFHGLGPFNIESGKVIKKKGSPPSYTEVFGKTLTKMAKKDKKIVAITAAMPEGTGLSYFRDELKERFFDVGIAEQHAVTFACGTALQGMKPVCVIYSTFLQRGFDQVIHDVCIQNIPMIFCIDRAGIVGEDGPTHHGTFDFSYLRILPNMVVMAPKDENELKAMLQFGLNYGKGPIAMRYPRGSAVGVAPKKEKIKLGRGEVLREGKDGMIIAIGSMVYPSLEAAEILEKEGIEVGVMNARFIKPLDKLLLRKIVKGTKRIITCEENVLAGGFGSAILEFLEDKRVNIPVLRLGLPDKFVEHGARSILLEKYGLSSRKIAKEIEKFCKR